MDDLFAAWEDHMATLRTTLTIWRHAHPRATLTDIETALDAELHRLRAQMLTDLAQTSPLADITTLPRPARPCCPTCQHPVRSRGRKTRHLQTTGGQDLALTRSYVTCSACGAGLFPPR